MMPMASLRKTSISPWRWTVMPRSCQAELNESLWPDIPAVGAPQKSTAHQWRQDRGDHEPWEGLAQRYFGAIGDAHGRQNPKEYEHQPFAFLTRSSTTEGSAR